MKIETGSQARHRSGVPGPEQQRLTEQQRKRFYAGLDKINSAKRDWAALVRKLGPAACARELGITPQALASRLRVIEKGDATRS